MADVTYEHFIDTDVDHADALVQVYQAAGRVAATIEPRRAVVIVYTEYDADAHRDICAEIGRIAESHGADYCGGGMCVGAIPGD